MTRLVRITGFLLIGAGAITALTWFVAPLRQIWPWFLKLPIAIQIGLGAATGGAVLVFASLLWERIEEREADRELKKDL